MRISPPKKQTTSLHLSLLFLQLDIIRKDPLEFTRHTREIHNAIRYIFKTSFCLTQQAFALQASNA